mgnify:CR=1 FL=1
MNAGAYGGEMKDVVVSTTYMDLDGNIKTINNAEHEFEYRNSIFSKMNVRKLPSVAKSAIIHRKVLVVFSPEVHKNHRNTFVFR